MFCNRGAKRGLAAKNVFQAAKVRITERTTPGVRPVIFDSLAAKVTGVEHPPTDFRIKQIRIGAVPLLAFPRTKELPPFGFQSGPPAPFTLKMHAESLFCARSRLRQMRGNALPALSRSVSAKHHETFEARYDARHKSLFAMDYDKPFESRRGGIQL